MSKRIQSEVVEECVRTVLKSEGFALSEQRTRNGETGVDILAQKQEEQIHIEVIGYKSTGPARSKDFFEVFFRAVSRLKDGARRCVIAIPDTAKRGLPQRAILTASTSPCRRRERTASHRGFESRRRSRARGNSGKANE